MLIPFKVPQNLAAQDQNQELGLAIECILIVIPVVRHAVLVQYAIRALFTNSLFHRQIYLYCL